MGDDEEVILRATIWDKDENERGSLEVLISGEHMKRIAEIVRQKGRQIKLVKNETGVIFAEIVPIKND